MDDESTTTDPEAATLSPAELDYAVSWVSLFPLLGDDPDSRQYYLEGFAARHGPPSLATFARLAAEGRPQVPHDATGRSDAQALSARASPNPNSDEDLDPVALA